MAATGMKQTTGSKRVAPQSKDDAISILRADHTRVDAMFKQFEKLQDGDNAEKAAAVGEICDELTMHATVEEEIFYPAVRAAIEDDDLMDEAEVEHASLKSLIQQLQKMKPGDDHYDAKVKVLSEYVKHHVKEEQDEMFPKARKAKLDLKALGQQIVARKKPTKTEKSAGS